MTMKPEYNDRLSTDEQLEYEERIAAYLFDTYPDTLSEEEAAQAGRDILLMILRKFRKDFFGRTEHDPRICGCEYRGNNAWSCGHIDALRS